MPSIDHDARRRAISKTALSIIAREGLDAATIRRIAAELGGPTRIVTHYFSDKQELLLWSYQELADRARRAVDAVVGEDPTDIVGALIALGAVGETGLVGWRAYLALSDHAARDPAIAAVQRANMKFTVERLCNIIRDRNGDVEDLEGVAERLNGLMQGISIQALVDQERWSSERIRDAFAAEVGALLGQPAVPAIGEELSK